MDSVNNDSYYLPPEPTGMTDEELNEALTAALNDAEQVREAVAEVLFNAEMLELFKHGRKGEFEDKLREAVADYLRAYILRDES